LRSQIQDFRFQSSRAGVWIKLCDARFKISDFRVRARVWIETVRTGKNAGATGRGLKLCDARFKISGFARAGAWIGMGCTLAPCPGHPQGAAGGIDRLRKNSFGLSFRGVRQPTDDEESRKSIVFRARFLAPLPRKSRDNLWGHAMACPYIRRRR
jgi:hypothetical protein